jgi:hypothetical protein
MRRASPAKATADRQETACALGDALGVVREGLRDRPLRAPLLWYGKASSKFGLVHFLVRVRNDLGNAARFLDGGVPKSGLRRAFGKAIGRRGELQTAFTGDGACLAFRLSGPAARSCGVAFLDFTGLTEVA